MFGSSTLQRLRIALRNISISPYIAEPSETLQLEKQEIREITDSCERALLGNILTFWYPEVIDLQTGGYRLNHDQQGVWRGPANKCLVTQARTCWFFSRLSRSKYGNSEHLDAAHHGYEFIRNNMWDRQHGGFYWEVDSSGHSATKPGKHLYAQAFGLYALLEYARASGDTSAMSLAQQLFNLLEHTAHDAEYGGYRESFRRDWSLTLDGTSSYMDVDTSLKLMNTHLHLAEAITQYCYLTGDSLAMARLNELISVLSNFVVNTTADICTDKHSHNWKPLLDPHKDRVSYGHQLENIWILIEACRVADLPANFFLNLYRKLFDYALIYGFDQRAGGFYNTGRCNQMADQRDKIWWVQAESIVSALWMYNLTREKRYFDCFLQTLDWIMKHQIDWSGGDWHARISEARKPSGDKAGAWKSPYHNGRAMIQCLELLSTLSSTASDSTPTSG